MNPLTIDLNELVSKEVTAKIASLEETIETLKNRNIEINSKFLETKKHLDSSLDFVFLVQHLKTEFNTITATKESNDTFAKGKPYNQYIFLREILNKIFNIKKEAKWYGDYKDNNFRQNLAINFYEHKELVIKLLKVLKEDPTYDIQFIQQFIMPYDYDYETVIKLLRKLWYNTNGQIFDINPWWVESGATLNNLPYSLFLANPLLAEDEVFAILLDTIQKKQTNYEYLFKVVKYNENITQEQIRLLGNCLIGIRNERYNDDIRWFIENYITQFDKPTLNYLSTFVNYDNQFNTFAWQRFPAEYQMTFLQNKPFDEVFKIISDYSCKWTITEKENFLKLYLNEKR